jgi:hypothetical protein
MAGYLLLDALILNTDRHHENWAVIRLMHHDGRVSHEVAPTFDHASALARNEPPEKLALWLTDPQRPAWYADRGEGGIFLRSEDPRGANPLKLLELVAGRWPAYFTPWLTTLENVEEYAILTTVDRVPPEVMAPAQREFAKALLRVTVRRVREMGG